MVFLSNETETKISPIFWKSRTIPQVCKSAKDAESRALDMCAEDAWYLAGVTHELLTGSKGRGQLEVVVKCDNLGVKDSLNTTKQVDNKKLRPIIQCIKDMGLKKEIAAVQWVRSEDCHADLLTKKGAKGAEKILKMFRTGRNVDC